MADSINPVLNTRIGKYVLIRLIGQGTYYTLYQAVDPQAGQMVLIKILNILADTPGGATEPTAVLEARLNREAQTLSAISHPNIVAIQETGSHDGFPYLVLEYLYGQPLRQRLDQKPLLPEEALDILGQLAAALDAMHDQEILHRDLRPSNLMLLQNKRVKLMNFGFARRPGDTTVTLMGTLVGEPAYLAPEQLRDLPATRSTDLWALGVLSYEMLAGRPPFQGVNFPLVAHQVLMGQPDPVPELSSAVQDVLTKALAQSPEDRYQRASELVAALRRAIGRTSALPTPLQSSSRLIPNFPTKPRVLWASAMVLALAAATVGFFFLRPAPPVKASAVFRARASHNVPPSPIPAVGKTTAGKFSHSSSPFPPAALSAQLAQSAANQAAKH